MTTVRNHFVAFSIRIKTNSLGLIMSFSDTVVQGEAIESDLENESNGDVSQKVNQLNEQIEFMKTNGIYEKKMSTEWQRSNSISR